MTTYNKQDAEKLYYYYLDKVTGLPIGKVSVKPVEELRIDRIGDDYQLYAVAADGWVDTLKRDIGDFASEHRLTPPEVVLTMQDS